MLVQLGGPRPLPDCSLNLSSSAPFVPEITEVRIMVPSMGLTAALLAEGSTSALYPLSFEVSLANLTPERGGVAPVGDMPSFVLSPLLLCAPTFFFFLSAAPPLPYPNEPDDALWCISASKTTPNRLVV
jgi:hypothetical protein